MSCNSLSANFFRRHHEPDRCLAAFPCGKDTPGRPGSKKNTKRFPSQCSQRLFSLLVGLEWKDELIKIRKHASERIHFCAKSSDWWPACFSHDLAKVTGFTLFRFSASWRKGIPQQYLPAVVLLFQREPAPVAFSRRSARLSPRFGFRSRVEFLTSRTWCRSPSRPGSCCSLAGCERSAGPCPGPSERCRPEAFRRCSATTPTSCNS